MRCPRCGSTHIRKTGPDRKLSVVIRLVVMPVRCFICGHQFHRPTAMTDGTGRLLWQQLPVYSNSLKDVAHSLGFRWECAS